MRFVFHVGMGKTGTTAIQHALAASGAELGRAGLRYIGMWAPWIGSAHDGSAPFHRFLALPPDKLRDAADRFLDWGGELAARERAKALLHSNEAFHAVPFFERLAERAEIRLIAYVRAPARWLPSAYLQWGVVHKTNPGPVAPFGVTGRRLMSQYREIRVLGEALGDLLELRPYPEAGDVLDDFGAAIGVRLARPEGRLQGRPSPVEAVLRAAFNSTFQEPVLPRLYNETMRLARGRASPPASARLAQIFDRSELAAIVAENADLLAWFARAGGLDLAEARPEAEAEADPAAVADGLLGALVDLAATQSREIAALRARLAEIEERLARP